MSISKLKLKMPVLMIVLLITCFSWLFGEPSDPQIAIAALIEEMKHAILESTPAVSSETHEKVRALAYEIAAYGETAVPLLEAGIDGETDGNLRRELVLTLARIPGERVDRKLMHLFCFDRPVLRVAGSELVRRTEQYGPFTFQVSDGEIAKMVEFIEWEHVFVIGDFMRVLAMCAQNPEQPRLRPILNRFIRDIKTPSEVEQVHAVGGSYTSPRVFALNKFLLAFRHMGPVVQPYLREAIQQARENNDAEVEKWLSMGLGITGAPEVTDYLKQVVLNDPDPYTRGQAISAYAQSAGQEAIPLLKTLLHDKTESEYVAEDMPGRYFIALIARDALVRLTQDTFQDTPYMRRIHDVLARHGLNKEEVFRLGGKEIGDLRRDINSTKGLNKARQISTAFQRQDMSYIESYIEKRRQNDPNDPFALFLEFGMNLSYRKYEACISDIEAMVALVNRNTFACDKYIITCIFSMIMSFEGTYRNYFLDPEGSETEELRLALSSIRVAYLFEREGCL